MKSLKDFESNSLLNPNSILKKNELISFVGGKQEKTELTGDRVDCYNDENVTKFQTSGKYFTDSKQATEQKPGDIEYGDC